MPINFIYFENFIVWMLKNNELLLYCLIDQSIIYSTNKNLYFHHIFNSINNEEELEKVYSIENLPLKIHANDNHEISYNIQKIINFALKVVRFNECFIENKPLNEKNPIKNKNPFEEYYKEINEFGNFIAYSDFMVKCCFHDRTLVTIDKNHDFVIILTKTGERITQKISEKNEFSM